MGRELSNIPLVRPDSYWVMVMAGSLTSSPFLRPVC